MQHRCLAICFIPATGKTISSFDIIYKSVMLGNNVRGLRGGKLFPRTPISALCRAFSSRGLRPCYRGGPFGALLVGLWPPTLHRPPVAGYGRGPSLRCVRLRHIRSLPPASALPNHAVLSHPLRGAYRAFESGSNVRGRERATTLRARRGRGGEVRTIRLFLRHIRQYSVYLFL